MIQISESAQTHFRRLLDREALPGLGVKLSAVHAGTPRADVRLEFAETAELAGDESGDEGKSNMPFMPKFPKKGPPKGPGGPPPG